MNDLAAIVLCGGASRRMGRDKAWLPFGVETMLQRVVRIVSQVCEPVVVIAGKNQELPPLSAEVRIKRDRDEYKGPVGALQLGFAALPSDRPMFACACDMPLLSAAVIRLLLSQHRPGHAVVPVVGGVRQPLTAIYDRSESGLMDSMPASLQKLLYSMPVIEVAEAQLRTADPQLHSFLRINDPQSYNEALEIWKATRET